jgi:hypothetical protein
VHADDRVAGGDGADAGREGGKMGGDVGHEFLN